MTDDPSTNPLNRIRIYESRGDTTVLIDVEIAEDGRLEVSGQDLGDAPEKYWGDSDYEYWVSVRTEHKDRLLLALMEKLYGGNSSVVSEFMEFLKSRGIPYEFGSWA
jgi:hypothetical protein